MTKRSRLIFFFFILVFPFSHSIYAQEVQLRIQNIKTADGSLCIGVFNSEESFKTELPYMMVKYEKTKMVNNEMLIKIKLEPGTNGITVLDDENNDGKMNWKYLAIPREGFGFGDYYHTGLKKPRYNNFSFEIDSKEKKNMIVKLRYF